MVRAAVSLLFLAAVLAPLVWLIGAAGGSGLLAGLAAVRAEPEFVRSYLDSLAAALSAAVLAVFVALPAAYGLTRGRGGGAAVGVLAVARCAPAAVFGPAVLVALAAWGWPRLLAEAAVLGACELPLAVWIVAVAMRRVPLAQDEAAYLDGLGGIGFCRRVLLPQVGADVALALLACFAAGYGGHVLAAASAAGPPPHLRALAAPSPAPRLAATVVLAAVPAVAAGVGFGVWRLRRDAAVRSASPRQE